MSSGVVVETALLMFDACEERIPHLIMNYALKPFI